MSTATLQRLQLISTDSSGRFTIAAQNIPAVGYLPQGGGPHLGNVG